MWLFGSRARGEPASHEGSDVDVLVLVNDDSWDAKVRIRKALDQLACELDLGGVSPWFSVHVNTPERLEQRRGIKSFFVAEIDRDKIAIESPS